MRNFILTLILAGILIAAAATPVLAQESYAVKNPELVNVLKSDASFKDKSDACRDLAVQGGKDAIPVLAPMLLDEKLSHLARMALEPMPFPEAGQVLRDALGKASNPIKVGIMNSLAMRKDEQAVPAMIALLADADPVVAQTAALSLGMIATPDAVKALDAAIGQANVSPANLEAFCDGLLGCAERLAVKGQRDQAAALYDRVLKVPNVRREIHTGAFLGAVLNHSAEKAVPLLLEALRGESEDGFSDALRASRQLSADKKITAALADALPALAPERKVRLIDVLGQRGGEAAGTALLAEAKEGPVEVRVAAVKAMTRMGYSQALRLIEQLACAEEGDVTKAARESLSFFPGEDGDAVIKAMLKNSRAATRRVAVELIGQGGLAKAAGLLMNMASADADESVRIAALKALQDCAGIGELPGLLDSLLKAKSDSETQAAEKAVESLCNRQKRMPGDVVIQKAVYGDLPDGPQADVTKNVAEFVKAGSLSVDASNDNFGDPAPGKVKKLRVEYTVNGAPRTRTVKETETLKLANTSAPVAVSDALCSSLEKAQAQTKPAVLRLLGCVGGPKAFEAVHALATSGEGAVKDTALRVVCGWPTPEALPFVTELSKTADDETLRTLALRGTVRLLVESESDSAELTKQYAQLMQNARNADEKKAILSGIAQVQTTDMLELVFNQFGDESVKAEAVQAAIAIAKGLGNAAREDDTFFSGKDLTGWQGNAPYWSFDDGAIVGRSEQPLAQNEFIWSNVEVRDFYLVVDVKLEPNTGNGGIQFRSKKVNEHGQALGYQADVGQDVWGRLYHEHGRGKLDWTDRADGAVKPGEWNHYEILAVGPAIWTAINGKLGVAFLDLNKEAERSGLVAVQIHAGPPMTARYRFKELTHNPRIRMEGVSTEDLISALTLTPKL